MFKIQSDEFLMSGFYCIVLIEYMIIGKGLLEYNNLFSPNDYRKDEKIMWMYFKSKYESRNKIVGLKIKKELLNWKLTF